MREFFFEGMLGREKRDGFADSFTENNDDVFRWIPFEPAGPREVVLLAVAWARDSFEGATGGAVSFCKDPCLFAPSLGDCFLNNGGAFELLVRAKSGAC